MQNPHRHSFPHSHCPKHVEDIENSLKLLSCSGLLLQTDNSEIAADWHVQQTREIYLQFATSISGKLSVCSSSKSTVINTAWLTGVTFFLLIKCTINSDMWWEQPLELIIKMLYGDHVLRTHSVLSLPQLRRETYFTFMPIVWHKRNIKYENKQISIAEGEWWASKRQRPTFLRGQLLRLVSSQV